MNTKKNKLSELSDILAEKSKLDNGILTFVRQFKIGILLKSFSQFKKQGYSVVSVITRLIFIRLGGMSIYD
ncbi:MAG TPA: hypothetical protein GXZ87_02475 [Bacteroidales bacterium]|nr:hypothetical protein [Bacteroidales bacterium]